MHKPENDFFMAYERYFSTIYRLCFSYMKNREDTEDAVQITFEKLLRLSKHFENGEHEKAWLIVTAGNTCKDLLRQFNRKNVSIDKYEFTINDEDESKEFALLIMDLPNKYKTVVYLFYYEGYKSDEIAKILHKPSSTIRNYLTEARRYLKKILEEAQNEK